jgi:cell wall-associated NlpC family hydrolase
MVLSYAYCNVSVMPVRSEPSHKAEQVNEVLFGERVEVQEVNEKDWAKIRCEWDGYEGWCKFGQLATITRREYNKPPKALAATHNDKIVFENGEQSMPMGCDIFGFKGAKVNIAGNTGKYKGKKLKTNDLALTADNLKAAALKYLYAPYLWGGRTMNGIDCSGLTQMAFKLCGTPLPRDADQQAKEGEGVDFLQHARCGDLAFFDNTDGKIVHVGLLLDHDTIIHATDSSGRVVIDRIDQGGIISVNLKKRTHNLRFVKRLF